MLATKYGKKGLTTRTEGKISPSQVDRLVSHPFYYGFIEDIDEDDNPILRPHRYDRIIDKAFFDRCQDVKHGRGHNKYKRTEEEFVFNGLITCSLVASLSSYRVKTNNKVYLQPNRKKDQLRMRKLR